MEAGNQLRRSKSKQVRACVKLTPLELQPRVSKRHAIHAACKFFLLPVTFIPSVFLTIGLLCIIGGQAARPADPNVLISASLEVDDVNKYDVTQVYTFVLEKER